MKSAVYVGLFILFFLSCDQNRREVEGEWINGTEQEQIKTIEKHFRGFDMAMVETAYRYQELYWAGKDENWEYAAYQNGKIRTSVENGLERRPKRAQSAQNFLNIALPEMDSAIANRDTLRFNEAFNSLTSNCTACHAMEMVPYITVKTPLERLSPVRNQ